MADQPGDKEKRDEQPQPLPPEGPCAVAPAAEGQGAAPQVGDAELQELRKKAEERDALWDRLLRAHADFDNWRKRIERESRDVVRFANAELVEELLPILDNLDRTIKAAETADDIKPLLEGIRLVQRQFLDVLAANDVKPITVLGEKFDPQRHEAISVIHTADQAPFTILEEAQRGFMMHDRVIRPAQVVLAAGPSTERPGEKHPRTEKKT